MVVYSVLFVMIVVELGNGRFESIIAVVISHSTDDAVALGFITEGDTFPTLLN